VLLGRTVSRSKIRMPLRCFARILKREDNGAAPSSCQDSGFD
jgi:hypothetical protein